MIKIYESNLEDKSYEYNGHTISDRGNWVIDDIGKEFATDREADEFIDNPSHEVKIASDEEEWAVKKFYQIPKRKMTLGEIRKNYPEDVFYVYFLQYRNDGRLFAGKNGLCRLSDDNVEIFKTDYDAKASNERRNNKYYLTYAKLEDGEILWDFI